MNIAIFSDSYLPLVNGVASSLGLLNQQFLALGHEVTVFAPKVNSPVNDLPNVVRLNSVKISNAPPFYIGSPVSPKVLNIFKNRKFDVVHVHTPLTMGLLAYQAARLFKKPLIYTYHTILSEYLHYAGWLSKLDLSQQLIRYVDMLTCNLCDLVVAPSVKVKKFLQGRGVATPFEIVPNGVRLDRFATRGTGFLRTRPDIGTTDKILLFVGRLGHEKNPAFMLRVLSLLLPTMPDVKLVFAGDGYLLPQLKQLAARLRVDKNVIFLGNVLFNDMPALYADADIFVSSATSEVHPMALLEAIASGLPVVAVNDDAFALAVADGQNGFLTAPDERVFAKRALEILHRPELRHVMALESLKRSRQFSVEAQAGRLLDIYATLAAGYQGAHLSRRRLFVPQKFS